jgi:hypothetical protein
MQTNTDYPFPNEHIRDWLRRVKKMKYNAASIVALADQYWPKVRYIGGIDQTILASWLQEHINRDDYIWVCSSFWFTHDFDSVLFTLTWTTGD